MRCLQCQRSFEPWTEDGLQYCIICPACVANNRRLRRDKAKVPSELIKSDGRRYRRKDKEPKLRDMFP